jgi:hypothetical protein
MCRSCRIRSCCSTASSTRPPSTSTSKRDDLEYTVISAFDYFFEDSEGQRLNGQFHQSVWTGEKGLDNVTGVTKKIYWGAYGPNAAGGHIRASGGGSSSIFYNPTNKFFSDRTGALMNLIQRATRTQKTVDIWKGRPFSDGKFDCVQLVKAHARHLGGSIKVPRYHDVKEAAAALRELGHKTLGEALDARFHRIATAQILVGDIVETLGSNGFSQRSWWRSAMAARSASTRTFRIATSCSR